MNKTLRMLTPVALLLLLGVVLAACTAGAGQAQVSASDIITKMREAMKTTQTSQATTDLSLTINKDGIKTLVQGIMGSNSGMTGGDTSGVAGQADWLSKLPDSATATIKTWRQAPNNLRVEIDSTSVAGARGDTLVYDGNKVYALDVAHNTIYTATPGNMSQMPAELQAALQGGDLDTEIDKLISAADIKLQGTEKIAGVDAYKLDITPKPDAATTLGIPQAMAMQAGVLIKDLHVTLWVDTSRWIPLKVVVEHPNIGNFSATVSQIDLNKPIDHSTFVLQAPAGSKTVDLDQMKQNSTPKSLTLPQARDAATQAGWKLLEPSYLPDGATLVGVRQMNMPVMSSADKGGTFMLSYSSPSADFMVVESQAQPEKMLGDGFSGINDKSTAGKALKDVTIHGVTARAFSPDGTSWTVLSWQEKSGTWVVVSGKISLDEATKIADGLK